MFMVSTDDSFFHKSVAVLWGKETVDSTYHRPRNIGWWGIRGTGGLLWVYVAVLYAQLSEMMRAMVSAKAHAHYPLETKKVRN